MSCGSSLGNPSIRNLLLLLFLTAASSKPAPGQQQCLLSGWVAFGY
jgi:hypothetical protein